MAQLVKNPSVMQETWVRSLGWEDFPGVLPTPVFLSGEYQGQESGGLPSMGSHRVGHD